MSLATPPSLLPFPCSYSAPPQLIIIISDSSLTDDHSCWNNHRCSDYDSPNIIQSNDDSCNIFKGLHQPPNLLDLLDKNMSVTLSAMEAAASCLKMSFFSLCADLKHEPIVAVVIFPWLLCPHSKRKYKNKGGNQTGSHP